MVIKQNIRKRRAAERFHLELWIFVHGIASMIATSYLDWEMETVSEVLTDAYLRLKARFCAAVKAMIAVSPQETAVAPNLTVWENLELMAGVHGFRKSEARDKVAELSGRFSLGAVAGKRAGRYVSLHGLKEVNERRRLKFGI